MGDYNGDGFADLVVVIKGYETNCVYYIPSIGKGILGEPTKLFGSYGDYDYTYFTSKDFNKDGNLDLMICLEKSGYILEFLGDGHGSFNLSWEIDGPTIIKGSEGRNYEYFSDIDNDTIDDILVLTDCVYSEPRKGCLSFYPGMGEGAFGKLNIIDSNIPRISLSYSIASGDFNRDGLMDFAVGTLDSIETPGLSIFVSSRITKVDDIGQSEEVLLLQCSPNPFNSFISITYQLNKENSINIEIFDILGRKVKNLLNEKQKPGKYTLCWKGDDFSGKIVSSGVFFCIVSKGSGKILKANKLMLMK